MSERTVNRRNFLKGAAGILMAGTLAGCGAEPTATPAPTATSAKPAATATPSLKYAAKACVHKFMHGFSVNPGKEDHLVKELQEEALRKEYGINVDIQIETASFADVYSLQDLRIQTQEVNSVAKPDAPALTQIAKSGLLYELEPVLKEYGKNLLELLPASGFQYFANAQGKYMAIPWLRDAPVDPEYYHIRRDWLEKIGRDIPATVEELEECLRLFKEKKLGGAVTIPLTTENSGWIPQFLLAGPFAPEPDEQFKMLGRGENIERTLGCIMREERLDTLQRWYKDGLLDSEYANAKADTTITNCNKGMVGCVLAAHTYTNAVLQTQVEKTDPKQDWVQIFPPPGRKGKANTGRVIAGGAVGRVTTVMSWTQCPEAIVALYDWQIKKFENYVVSVHGIEGKHWKWGSGGWIEDLRSKAPNQEYSGNRRIGQTTAIKLKYVNLPTQPGAEPKDREWAPRIYNNFWTRKQGHVAEKGEYPMLVPVDIWCPYLLVNSAKYRSDLNSLMSEYIAKMIRGDMSATAGVKEFWSRWNAAGGTEVQKERMDIYNKWIAQHPEWKDPKATFAPETWNSTAKYPPKKTT
jgi:hypothetical protein